MTRRLFLGVLPLALLAALLVLIVRSGPTDLVRGDNYPPVERLMFQRVVLEPGFIVASVLNDGPDQVTIAQVQVDEAFWTFTADSGVELGHLSRTTLRIPYPWVDGEAHLFKVLTSTGTAFEHEIAVAVETPTPGIRFFGIFTLIGLYVGVIPVAIGLLWFPFVKRLSVGATDFLLALTVGLLAFLLVDGASEGLESAGMLPESFQGVVLFALAAAGAYLLLEGVGAWLRARRQKVDAGRDGWVLALLIAVGIGLHNFGEGLAIGSAFALGEAALGTLLIVGFTLHNTTEGLAIVAPLARDRERVSVADLAKLGLIGGVPTIAGAWVGGFVYSPVWSVLFLAIGVGAIAQVVGQIVRQMTREGSVARMLATGPVLAGLFAGFAVMYVTGMLVG
ncbi:MAG: metal transporter [Acidobacteria bacterium]|nr:metal transporter [Acidobacteriota bacterium]